MASQLLTARTAPHPDGTAGALAGGRSGSAGAAPPAPPLRRRALASHSRARGFACRAAGLALIGVVLAACGGSGGSDSATSAGSVAERAGVPANAAPEKGVQDSAPSPAAGGGTGSRVTAKSGSETSTSSAARVLPSDRDVIYRGSIHVRVRDIGQAVARAEDLTIGVNGVVFTEQTSTDPKHPRFGQATMTLRVPPTAFGPTLDAIGDLGKELDRQRSAEDVTTQVTDVDSRLKTQRRSVDRVRILLSQADTIGDVVRVESELSRREADLESLEAQLKKLHDLADLATIDVVLVSPQPHHKPKPKPDDDNLGFLTGLQGGWDAFVGVVVVALTVIGALVPFAIAAALIGVPLLLLWRSRRRTSTPPPPPTNPTPADA